VSELDTGSHDHRCIVFQASLRGATDIEIADGDVRTEVMVLKNALAGSGER
jgi:hypothetical protein